MKAIKPPKQPNPRTKSSAGDLTRGNRATRARRRAGFIAIGNKTHLPSLF